MVTMNHAAVDTGTLAEIFSGNAGIIVWYAFILSIGFGFTYYIWKRRDNQLLFQYLPAILTSLGICGTFIGIAFGLLDAVQNPTQTGLNINPLLIGLCFGAFTSGALILMAILIKAKWMSNIVPEPHVSELNVDEFNTHIASVAVSTISSAISKIPAVIDKSMSDLATNVLAENRAEMEKNIGKMSIAFTNEMKFVVSQLTRLNQSTLADYHVAAATFKDVSQQMAKMIGDIDKVAISVSEIAKTLSDANKSTTAMKDKLDMMSQAVILQKVQDILGKVDGLKQSITTLNTDVNAKAAIIEKSTSQFTASIQQGLPNIAEKFTKELWICEEKLETSLKDNAGTINDLTLDSLQSMVKFKDDMAKIVDEIGKIVPRLHDLLRKPNSDDKKNPDDKK